MLPELYITIEPLALLVFASLTAFCFHRRFRSPLKDIPGPLVASFSTLWQIWHVIKGHTEDAILKQHRKHGHFVRVSHKEVSCSHPDTINAILMTPLRKGDWYKAMAVPDKHHQTTMSEQDPKRHRERSSIVAGAYQLSFLMKSEGVLDKLVDQLEGRLEQFAATGSPVELDKWLNYLAFDVIGELVYSRKFGFLDRGQDIGGSIANMRFLMFYQTIMGYMYWLHPFLLASPISGWLGLTPSRHIFETVLSAVNSRKEKPDSHSDMLEQWNKNYKVHPERMEEREILAVASMTTIAGSETMTGALESVFYFLLRHPQHLKVLQEELEKAQREGKLSKIVAHEETKELPYLQACVKETLRYFPPVPFGFPRIAPREGVQVGDRFFPQGTVLSINPMVIQRSTEFFGADADTFNPERWLKPNSQALDKYMVQFGAGYNGCPGKQFAYAEISKVVATLLRDFSFELVNPEKEWRFRTQFTVVQTGWPCRVKRRALHES